LIHPTVELAVEFNRSVRHEDEWFDEPDDLDRLDRVLESITDIAGPVDYAAVLAFRVTRSQAFGEGNKRTALLLARWTLDRNGLNGSEIFPSEDREAANLLVGAAAGHDVQRELLELIRSRAAGSASNSP
jgi:prophage maintenance system killer protein